MKNILLFSIVGAVVVGGIALFMIFSSDSEKNVKTDGAEIVQKEKVAEETMLPLTGMDSLSAIMALGQNLECTITYNPQVDDESVIEGTYFTSRGRMRGDFVVESMGSQLVSSVILDTEAMYSWSEIEGNKYGMKMTLSELQNAQADDSLPGANEAVPLDEVVSYDCKPWLVVDGSIFVPPNDIIFTNYGDMINMGMEFGNIYEGGEAMSSCEICDQATGEARAQCRVMMSCE